LQFSTLYFDLSKNFVDFQFVQHYWSTDLRNFTNKQRAANITLTGIIHQLIKLQSIQEVPYVINSILSDIHQWNWH
jgi:hypothetical protein